jgi:RNA-directed DNA polymerase
MPKDAPPNGDAPTDQDAAADVPVGLRRRVSEMQAKLHRWAAADPGRPGSTRCSQPWVQAA